MRVMKKYMFLAALTLAMMPAAAQDTYENARLLGSNLNGTARYVGMGGALDALGADISTIGTNPAGIGLFRHSYIGMSFGGVMQDGVKKFNREGKTNLSFDQAGFVYSTPSGDNSYVNFAFNYHKSRNFDQILSAANTMYRYNGKGASLGKLAYGKSTLGSDYYGGYYLREYQGEVDGYCNKTSNTIAYPYTQWDHVYTNGLLWDDVNFDRSVSFKNIFYEADEYGFDREHRGSISDFDFNLSGNINNRVFLGMTVGIHSVYYKDYSEYQEFLVDLNNNFIGNTVLADERKITGTGVDIKLGAIVRPSEDSPFRIGFSIATPTWYDLKSSNNTCLINATDYEALHPQFRNWGRNEFDYHNTYEFKYYTPWKFGLSLGHTIDNYLALGAGFDYSDYSCADTRINDGYDAYGNPDSYSDDVMNDNTDRSLKGVATVRVGAELKPNPSMAIRLGYNYETAMYDEKGVRDMTLNSIGTFYASTADYTNWKATQRITCGFGYKYEGWNFDIAYQYNTTKGTFYPFQPDMTFTDIVADDAGVYINETNISTPTDVKFNRHQLLFTIGYTF